MYVASSPKRFSYPESKFAFIISFGHVGVPVEFEFDCSDCLVVFLFAYGITFASAENVSDNFKAFCIGFSPSTQNQTFRYFWKCRKFFVKNAVPTFRSVKVSYFDFHFSSAEIIE